MTAAPQTAERPIAVLIAAMGGQGGGVLTNWLVAAAMSQDLPVQSTSIPGVAQRTGATTYYVEIFPRTHAELGERRPVLGLYPVAGAIDVMVASELVEAGRAVQNGFVSPERTTLIAATHRVFATSEKMAMGDGRVDSRRILRAVMEIPQHAVLFDPTRSPRTQGLPLNALLFGAMAGSGKLPVPQSAFEDAIRASGIAVEANLEGFRLGVALARGEKVLPITPEDAGAEPGPAPALPAMLATAAARYPAEAIRTIELGLARVADFQDEEYAHLYLERLDRLLENAVRGDLLNEAARHLALWMAYEDIIRVADLKSRPDRYARVRAEVRAGDKEPVRVVEVFKPGIEEVAALLPPGLGRRLQDWGLRTGRLDTWRLPMRVTSTSLTGYLRLRLLAKLRPWRRRTLRFAEEQAMIERWLDAVIAGAAHSPALAREIVECARLLKGYGDTHRRGRTNFTRIFDTLVAPALEGRTPADEAAQAIRNAREAALADPDGTVLEQALAAPPSPRAQGAA